MCFSGGYARLLAGLTKACATLSRSTDMPPSYAIDVPAQGLLNTYMRQQRPDDFCRMSVFYICFDRVVDAAGSPRALCSLSICARPAN